MSCGGLGKFLQKDKPLFEDDYQRAYETGARRDALVETPQRQLPRIFNRSNRTPLRLKFLLGTKVSATSLERKMPNTGVHHEFRTPLDNENITTHWCGQVA